VRVLGIDETRRGKAKWETCPETGARAWVDRWDSGLVDITGAGGLLVQVNGRAARPVTDWLTQREQAWRDGIEFVAIDMSGAYAKAAREALPHAKLIVDRFHGSSDLMGVWCDRLGSCR
jgi:transposase